MKNEEIDRKERIKAEFDRIIVFFENLDDNKKAVILPLIQNAAFIKITLEDLRELIQRDGVVDYYQNGANQSGLKQSAALQSYNSLIKNYATIIKSLCDYLPPPTRKALSASWTPRVEEEHAEICRNVEEELALAAEFQKWQREQEAQGKKVTTGFEAWKRNKSAVDAEKQLDEDL